MTENTINQTATAWINSARETAQSVAATMVAVQERNARFAQTLVEKSIEQAESQTATARELTNTLVGQTEKQRAAYRDLVRESVTAYVDLLGTSAAIYQKSLNTLFETVKQPTAE